MTISPIARATPTPLNLRPSARNQDIDFEKTLTEKDKKIIQMISPSSGDAGKKKIDNLKVIIALDRTMGNLQGEIDLNYVNNLKDRLVTGQSNAIPSSVLDKLISVVSDGRHA